MNRNSSGSVPAEIVRLVTTVTPAASNRGDFESRRSPLGYDVTAAETHLPGVRSLGLGFLSNNILWYFFLNMIDNSRPAQSIYNIQGRSGRGGGPRPLIKTASQSRLFTGVPQKLAHMSRTPTTVPFCRAALSVQGMLRVAGLEAFPCCDWGARPKCHTTHLQYKAHHDNACTVLSATFRRRYDGRVSVVEPTAFAEPCHAQVYLMRVLQRREPVTRIAARCTTAVAAVRRPEVGFDMAKLHNLR